MPATNKTRELRLYQASFLLRDYHFDVEELPFGGDGALPLDVDPKSAWAAEHLAQSPIEINTAEKRDLMRVPGIGEKSAARIISARRQGILRELSDLRAVGVVNAQKAASYILLDGRKPIRQPRLF
jgi:predicted DNA-binding helix-hairpin-helix protein